MKVIIVSENYSTYSIVLCTDAFWEVIRHYRARMGLWVVWSATQNSNKKAFSVH